MCSVQQAHVNIDLSVILRANEHSVHDIRGGAFRLFAAALELLKHVLPDPTRQKPTRLVSSRELNSC